MMPRYPIDEPNDTTPLDHFYEAEEPENLTDEQLAELVTIHRREREARIAKHREREARKVAKATAPKVAKAPRKTKAKPAEE